MSIKDNGGPAFPETCGDQIVPGMTLRDYFAAKALQGLIGRVWVDEKTGRVPDNVFDLWAEASYQVADAMLAERAK